MRRGACALLVLTLIAGAAGAQDRSARFLGMAVCAGVGDGPDGLTVLRGVRNVLWPAALPATEDLVIYTRWTGSGVHSVSVAVTDPSTGAKLAESSDDIDFGNVTVTFFTSDLSATTFPTPGVYAVGVTLDGEDVAQYALYVDDAIDFPQAPAFVLSVPAAGGSIDSRGDAEITGIFEHVAFPRFPSAESLSFVTLWFSGDGSHSQYVQIADASGRVVANSTPARFTAAPGRMNALTDSFDRVMFDAPGTYTATVFLDGLRVFSSPLVIGAG
jgi:hypothetical protein